MPDAIAGYIHDGNVHEAGLAASSDGKAIDGWVSSTTACSSGLWTLTWSAPSQAKAAVLTGQAIPNASVDPSRLSSVTVGIRGEMKGNYCQQPVFYSVSRANTVWVSVRYQFWKLSPVVSPS